MNIRGINFISCKDKLEASEKALESVINNVDKDTLLLLSGGSSPKLLYKLITEKNLQVGAVALVDERYGEVLHINSNEKMIKDTTLIDYLKSKEIPFYGILENDTMKALTDRYEKIVKDLFNKFSKKVAIMGIGADAHTAGIKPDLDYDHSKYVVCYDDKGLFGKRITLTFEALSCIDEFIVLVFGEEKKEALVQMSLGTDRKQLPAVFFKENPGKVRVLTDISIDF